MKIDKKQILSALKDDFRASELLRSDIDANIKRWKSEHNGEPYGNEQNGKSKIISRDIKKQSAWQHASLLDPFVSTSKIIKCNPITWEDKLAAEQNELLLNTQFCRKFDRYNFMTKAIKLLDREGTCVIQVGWDYRDEEVEQEVEVVAIDENGMEYLTVETQTVTKVLKNQPTAKICRNEDIFIDPTCQDDVENAQFIIYRYETDLSTLRQDGRYSNLEKLSPSNDYDSDSDYEPEDTTNFKFQDAPRKKLIVYEYWGNYDINGDEIAEPIVCAWVDNTIIRLQDNPYPDKKHPFIIVPFSSVPFQVHGEANAELIGDNQKVKTAILRGMIDNMAQSNNGQVGTRRGSMDAANRQKWLQGKNFEFTGNPQTDFWQGSYNQMPSTAFDMLGLMNNEIESITGVKSFSGGISGSGLGSSATAARGALDAASTRRLDLVRNIAENLVKPLMRKWMVYNAEFLTEEEVVRITNGEFVEVRRDDLAGQIDIDMVVATREEDSAKAQELTFMLQTMGNSLPFEITKVMLQEQAKLSRMPDMEKRIAEIQPPQDPRAERIKDLEILRLETEIEKMRADIEDKRARAAENTIDARVKEAKALVEEAKARKLNSDADLGDLKFMREDGGYTHLEAMEKERLKQDSLAKIKEQDRIANLEAMLFQARNRDNNIGVLK